MKILLDECLDRRLAKHLSANEVHTVPQMGWAGKKNGELLRLAQDNGFSVFVTIDQHLLRQQNLSQLRIGVVVISAATNSMADLLPLVPESEKAIADAAPGRIAQVG